MRSLWTNIWSSSIISGRSTRVVSSLRLCLVTRHLEIFDTLPVAFIKNATMAFTNKVPVVTTKRRAIQRVGKLPVADPARHSLLIRKRSNNKSVDEKFHIHSLHCQRLGSVLWSACWWWVSGLKSCLRFSVLCTLWGKKSSALDDLPTMSNGGSTSDRSGSLWRRFSRLVRDTGLRLPEPQWMPLDRRGSA